MPKKNGPSTTATVSFVSESSAFQNVLGGDGTVETSTVAEYGSPQSFTFDAGSGAQSNLELVNSDAQNPNQSVRYYTDLNGNGSVDGADALIFEGKPDDFTFADLLAAAEASRVGRFILAFDDGGAGPDRDYNDFVATLTLNSHGVRANAGRGNGSEIAFVNGIAVELDPGNSSIPPNNGGDFVL
jgi:hypothetical protein